MHELLLEIMMVEYQREIERKAKLEAKALSYVTIISIIISTSLVLMLYFTSTSTSTYTGKIVKVLYFIMFLGVLDYSVFTIIFSLISMKMSKMNILDINEIELLWNKDKADIEGSVFKTIKKIIKENSDFNKRIENNNELSYIYLWITMVFYLLQIGFSLLIIFGGIK